MNKYLAFDIGGTKIKWGIVNDEGKVLEKGSFNTNVESEEKFLEEIIKVALEKKGEVSGVALSMPGFIDSNNGIPKVCYAIRCMEGKNITKIIEEATGLKAAVENDGKCVALAEKFNGAAKECSDFICITIGTGIGGGIFVNNALLKGSTFQGGEFGFMRCSDKGIYSNTSSTLSLIKEYMKHKNIEEQIEGHVVFDEGQRDSKVKEIINNWYNNIAVGIFNLSATFNPEKILIGGGVSVREEFIDELKEALSKIDCWEDVKSKIEPCYHKNEAGIIGAVYNLKNK